MWRFTSVSERLPVCTASMSSFRPIGRNAIKEEKSAINDQIIRKFPPSSQEFSASTPMHQQISCSYVDCTSEQATQPQQQKLWAKSKVIQNSEQDCQQHDAETSAADRHTSESRHQAVSNFFRRKGRPFNARWLFAFRQWSIGSKPLFSQNIQFNFEVIWRLNFSELER